jgi:hypothetical protein
MSLDLSMIGAGFRAIKAFGSWILGRRRVMVRVKWDIPTSMVDLNEWFIVHVTIANPCTRAIFVFEPCLRVYENKLNFFERNISWFRKNVRFKSSASGNKVEKLEIKSGDTYSLEICSKTLPLINSKERYRNRLFVYTVDALGSEKLHPVKHPTKP